MVHYIKYIQSTMEEILDDAEKVSGHIYYILNKTTNRGYVGQAVSHRKNRGKYRPFGYMGRFNDHISEALCNTKKKQCTYLNNAIRLYGADAFEVRLLHTCSKDDMNQWESHYIESMNTLYPNGYNLTRGGKTLYVAKVVADEHNPVGKHGGCKFRSSETRALISKRLKKEFGKKEVREERMTRVQQQHYQQKLDRFKGAAIDVKNLDQYIRIQHHKEGHPIIVVRVDGKKASFVGKHETEEKIIERAKEFLRTVAT